MQYVTWLQENGPQIIVVVLAALTVLDKSAALFVKIAKLTPWTWDDKPAADFEGLATRIDSIASQVETLLTQAGVKIPPVEK